MKLMRTEFISLQQQWGRREDMESEEATNEHRELRKQRQSPEGLGESG